MGFPEMQGGRGWGLQRDTVTSRAVTVRPPGMGMVTMPTLALGEATLTRGHHADLRVSCLPNSAAD